MNDRELLELAAKAAGIDLCGYEWRNGWFCLFAGDATNFWNPLRDDGDALRLAVKLQLWTHTGMGSFNNEPDPYAATRRAIVRAAAEIGSPCALAAEKS